MTRFRLPCLVLSLALCTGVARAATVTWDADGTAGGPTGGTGTWNNSSALWNNAGSMQAWDNAANDVAFFGGTSGTVTLTTSNTANGLTFSTAGYQLTGGTLAFAGATPTITVSASTAIASGLASGTSLLITGTSPLTFTGTMTVGGTFSTNASRFTVGGAGMVTGTTLMQVGSAADARATMQVDTTRGVVVTGASAALRVGVAGGGAGALIFSSGTVAISDSGSLGYLSIGAVSNSYGYFEMSGGRVVRNGSGNLGALLGDAAGAVGVFVQSGGTTSFNRFIVLGSGGNASSGFGQMTLTGGVLESNASGDWFIVGDDSSGRLNVGTLAGGSALISATSAIKIGLTGSAASGYFNLNSGTVQFNNSTAGIRADQDGRTPATRDLTLSLNGGTIRSNANNIALVWGGTDAPLKTLMFNGGLTVDTGTFGASIDADILATTGNGFYRSTTFTATATGSAGAGYVGPPVVSVTGGSGTGAQVNALVDTAAGTITGFVVTNPGQNYQVGDVLTLTLSGTAAASTPAAPYTYTLQASDLAANGTGVLTKTGSGTLTLSGSNTYTGPTNISGGVLALGSAGSIANSGTVTVGAAGSAGVVLDLTAKSGSYAFGSGQTIKGIGTINIGAGKTVSSAGIWAPGNSIGSNAVTGNLTLTGTSQFELGTPGTSTTNPGSSDFTAVSGTLTLGGNLALLDNSGSNSQGSYGAGAYRLFTAPTVSGSFASVTAPAGATTTRVGMVYGSGTSTGQGVFANVYNLASATTAQTVNVGNMYAGGTQTAAVTIQNTAPSNATYTETLSTGGFASTSANFTAEGSAGGIAGGSSGTGTLVVGLGSGLSAGAVSGTTTLALFSNAVNSSGLAQQSITAQTITITGTVWNPAAVNAITSPVSLGNVRVSGTFGTQALSIQNTAASGSFTEVLGATGGSSGLASLTGSVVGLAGGGTSTAISVGLGGSSNTGSAGIKSGSATISFTSTGGPGTAVIDAQTVAVTGTVWNPAAATTSGSVNLGSVIVGATTAWTQALSVTNSAPNTGYSESLNASFGTLSGVTTNSGSFNLLPAGSTNNTALTVGLATGSVGNLTGSAQINFATDGQGTSGLAAAALSPQTVNVYGTVLDHALPGFVGTGITDPYAQTTLTLDFGTVQQSAGIQNLTYSLTNLVSQLYGQGLTAGLDLTAFTPNGDGFTSGLATFADLVAGGTSSLLTASFTPSATGTFTKTFTLSFADDQTLAGAATVRNLTIDAQVVVVPEPAAIAIAGIGVAAAAWVLRQRSHAPSSKQVQTGRLDPDQSA